MCASLCVRDYPRIYTLDVVGGIVAVCGGIGKKMAGAKSVLSVFS